MPLKAIEARRLYQEIAEQILLLIQGAEYRPGSRLPSERELASQLKVSRPSVREALIALEVEGRVEVKPGSGIFVSEPKLAVPDLSLSEGPLEIMRAREIIEGEIAYQVTPLMKESDIKALKHLIAAMERDASNNKPAIEADRDFHTYIAEKYGNSVLTRIVVELFNQRYSPLGIQFGLHFESPESRVEVISEHKKIVSAFASEKPERARKAMHKHLRRSHDRWTKHIGS